MANQRPPLRKTNSQMDREFDQFLAASMSDDETIPTHQMLQESGSLDLNALQLQQESNSKPWWKAQKEEEDSTVTDHTDEPQPRRSFMKRSDAIEDTSANNSGGFDGHTPGVEPPTAAARVISGQREMTGAGISIPTPAVAQLRSPESSTQSTEFMVQPPKLTSDRLEERNEEEKPAPLVFTRSSEGLRTSLEPEESVEEPAQSAERPGTDTIIEEQEKRAFYSNIGPGADFQALNKDMELNKTMEDAYGEEGFEVDDDDNEQAGAPPEPIIPQYLQGVDLSSTMGFDVTAPRPVSQTSQQTPISEGDEAEGSKESAIGARGDEQEYLQQPQYEKPAFVPVPSFVLEVKSQEPTTIERTMPAQVDNLSFEDAAEEQQQVAAALAEVIKESLEESQPQSRGMDEFMRQMEESDTTSLALLPPTPQKPASKPYIQASTHTSRAHSRQASPSPARTHKAGVAASPTRARQLASSASPARTITRSGSRSPGGLSRHASPSPHRHARNATPPRHEMTASLDLDEISPTRPISRPPVKFGMASTQSAPSIARPHPVAGRKKRFEHVVSSGYTTRSYKPPGGVTKKKPWTPADASGRTRGSQSAAVARSPPPASSPDVLLQRSVENFVVHITDLISPEKPQFRTPDQSPERVAARVSASAEIQRWQKMWTEERLLREKLQVALAGTPSHEPQQPEQNELDTEVVRLKQENNILKARVRQSSLSPKKPTTPAEAKDRELAEQEELLSRFEAENRRMYAELQALQKERRGDQQALHEENERQANEISRLKGQLESRSQTPPRAHTETRLELQRATMELEESKRAQEQAELEAASLSRQLRDAVSNQSIVSPITIARQQKRVLEADNLDATRTRRAQKLEVELAEKNGKIRMLNDEIKTLKSGARRVRPGYSTTLPVPRTAVVIAEQKQGDVEVRRSGRDEKLLNYYKEKCEALEVKLEHRDGEWQANIDEIQRNYDELKARYTDVYSGGVPRESETSSSGKKDEEVKKVREELLESENTIRDLTAELARRQSDDSSSLKYKRILADTEAELRQTREHLSELQLQSREPSSRLLELESRMRSQENFIAAQAQAHAQERDELRQARRREALLEERIRKLLSELQLARESHTPQMRHWDALQERLDRLGEKRYHGEDHAIKETLGQRDEQLRKFRSELDVIVSSLQQIKRQQSYTTQ